ncbi:NIPSNAP family protein [Streptomyces capparidis]
MWRVVELRRYTLHPGRRDELVELFDRHFVESQEECGAGVLGQFRDLDAPDRFVWLRGFTGMDARREALEAFYLRHPAWREHRNAANATMVDSDDVLLLRPAAPDGAFPAPEGARPGVGAAAVPSGFVALTLHHLPGAEELAEFAGFFEERVRPVLAAAGAAPLACLRTEYADNDFPRLPVRTGEHVFAHVTLYPDAAAHAALRERLGALEEWRRGVLPELGKRLARPEEVLRLSPTARSALR